MPLTIVNKSIFIAFVFLFTNQHLFSADFEKFSVSCATEKTLENGRMYGYTDEYIIQDWLKASPTLFDGENAWIKGMRSGWIQMKMIQRGNKIYWSRYSNALETNMNMTLDLNKMQKVTKYEGQDSYQISLCIKNTWNKGIELADKVVVKK